MTKKEPNNIVRKIVCGVKLAGLLLDGSILSSEETEILHSGKVIGTVKGLRALFADGVDVQICGNDACDPFYLEAFNAKGECVYSENFCPSYKTFTFSKVSQEDQDA